jgi:NitT/TauT family transport system substrate-binding protein
VEAYVRVLREAEVLVRNPAQFDAMLKIARDTFPINAPGGERVLEVALRNSMPGFGADVDPKALQHAAQYLHSNGQIDRLVDTSRLLQR